MAYQNVGTPRFYVNVLEWLDSSGLLQGGLKSSNLHHLSPSVLKNWLSSDDQDPGWNDTIAVNVDSNIEAFFTEYSFAAFLGHNFNASNSTIRFQDYTYGVGNYGNSFTGSEVVNKDFSKDGFSIISWDSGLIAGNSNAISIRMDEINSTSNQTIDYTIPPTIGCAILGTYYDMPHSPDLKLTMTREMDGVKRIRTKGGADLVDHKYTKPPMWGDAGAWELYEGTPTNQELSRSGRRVWDLSFSYLQGSDMFGVNEIVGYRHYSDTFWAPGGQHLAPDTTYEDGDLVSDLYFNYNLLDDDNFFSQVIHKTNGGQLPFIFQPDKNNNNPDGFAICKFDSGFKFEQVANGVYNVKLKIREVW